MRNLQKGFTLIELVVVIVILGILAAVALPKYIDLETEANKAVAEGTAGALSGAAAMGFAQAKAQGATSYAPTCDGSSLQTGLGSCTQDTEPGECAGGTTTCVVDCGGQTATATLACYPDV